MYRGLSACELPPNGDTAEASRKVMPRGGEASSRGDRRWIGSGVWPAPFAKRQSTWPAATARTAPPASFLMGHAERQAAGAFAATATQIDLLTIELRPSRR